MPRLIQLALAGAMAMMASAQSSSATVTQVLIPIADQQPLVASVIGESPNDVKTLAIQCPPGTDSSECGFPEPITITAGPSTFHFQPPTTGSYNLLGEIDCTLTGSTEAMCGATIGIYDTEYIATATDTEWMNTPAATSSTTSATLRGSELVWISVTITAGLSETSGNSGGSSSVSASVTRSDSGSASASGSQSRSGSGMSATGTGSGSSSAAAASATGNDAAGLSGLAYSAAAAVLVALPMFLL